MNLPQQQNVHRTIVPAVVRLPFRVISSSQNISIPKQLPLNNDLQQANKISKSVPQQQNVYRTMVPTIVRQPFRDISSSQNISIPKQLPLDNDLHQANKISKSVPQQRNVYRTIVPTAVRQTFRDISSSQNISIPKQLPLDKDLQQANKISKSVKSTCHQVPIVDLNRNEEDDFSDEEFMPRKSKHVTASSSTIEKPTSKSKKKLSVCRLKKEDAKSLVSEAEEKSISDDSFAKVHDIFPSCFSYVVTSCSSLENDTWTATVRADIGSRSQAETWLAEFEKENQLDFRFRKSVDAENSDRLVFKRQYRCHHNTMPRSNASEGKKSKNFQSKNTNCPAYVRVTIKQKSMKWSSDYLLQAYPCEIVINHTHNHIIQCANALRRRRPSQAICEKFTNLLQKGYSPLAALECHKYDLQTEYGDDYYKVSADQSLCPSNFWVYKLYKKLCIQNYGPQTGDDMIIALKKFCEDYNKECQSECAKAVTTEDGQLVMVICTEMMKRASILIKGAAEILFVDSSGTMDSLNCKMFLLQTTCVAGAIPLGAIIVTSERESVLNVALDLWKSLLPQNAFYGRGPNVGPKLIMTDDCSSERNALQAAFRSSKLLLCLFHILQAFWRFVWNREQNVAKEDRGELFFLFRDLVYSESQEVFEERLECARNSEKMKKYHKVLAHLESYIPRAQDWALFYRKNLMTRGNDTNNYSEAGIKVFKDKVLERTKAFNPVHLSEFVVTRYDAYLKRRIIDVINNRASNVFKSRFYIKPEKLEDLTCEKLDSPPSTYIVKNISKQTEYVVVMDLEICSCPAGQSGAPCKHLSAVVQKFHLTSSLVHPLLQCNNPSIKKILFEVVHGHQNVPNEWFADLVQHENPQEACSLSESASMDAVEVTFESEWESAVNDGDVVSNSKSHISDEELKSLDDRLDAILSKYKESIRKDPQYVDAVKVFITQNEKLHSDSGLLSALHTFGKTSGPLPLGFQRKRSGSAIPVQPGSKARRTVYIGGRKAQFTGRPTKAMSSAPTTQDHSYGNSSKNKSTTSVPNNVWHKLPTRVYPAPHSLLQCATYNRMIGSNHSRK